jgi:hypothetical protein
MEQETQRDAALAPIAMAPNLIINNVTNYNSFLLFPLNHAVGAKSISHFKKICNFESKISWDSGKIETFNPF